MNIRPYTFFFRSMLLLVFLGITGTKPVLAQSNIVGFADKVIAVVGKNRIVLQSELEAQFAMAKLQAPAISDSFKCDLLTEMIIQKVLVEQAERDSLFVSDEDVEGTLDNRIRYYIRQYGSQEKLEEISGKTVYQLKDDNRDVTKEQMMAERMRGKILESVKVTPAEIKAFFDKVPVDSLPFYPATIEAGQIVIDPEVNAEVDKITREKLEDIRKKIVVEGRSFEMMAGMYSEDPGSRDNGGLYQDVTRDGGWASAFVNAAFKLQNGEVSPIVKTQFGYHIIQMVKRKGDKVDLRHILLRPMKTTADFNIALAKLDSIRQILNQGSLSFSEAVGKFSTDEMAQQTGGMIVHPETGSSELEIADLDPAMVMMLDTLKPGNYSAPQVFVNERGDQSARIVYLKTKTDPHKANLKDDYNKIMQVALQQKQTEHLQQWLIKTIPEYYIRIDPEYNNCNQIQEWGIGSESAKRY